MLADNPWALIFNAGEWSSGNWQAEMGNYLSSRSAQGWTGLYLSALGNIDNGGTYENGNTWDNVPPFTGGGHPSAGFNNTYWQRVDYLISTAASYGLTVFLNIAYTADGTGNGNFDTGGALDSGALTQTDYTDYGTALGNRYGASPNLVWMYGNDYYATNETQFPWIRDAIAATGDTHAMAFHVKPESTSRYDIETGTDGSLSSPFSYTYSQVNWVYSYNVTYFGIERAYEEAAAHSIAQLPAVWGDGYGYNSGAALPTDQMMRQMSWWALSSGARGMNNISNDIQKWDSGSPAAVASSTDSPWYTSSAGAMRTLVESLPNWWKLMPDTSSALVTSGRGTHASGISTGSFYNGGTDNYVSASRVADGSLAIIYCAKAFSITIDQTKMAAGYTATWVDPATGAKTAATTGSSYSSSGLGNNSQGEPDWALILQGPLP